MSEQPLKRRDFLKTGTGGLLFAGVAPQIATADSETENPIEIEDWHDLNAIRDDLNSDYILVTNLDEDTPGYDEHVGDPDEGWSPIGNSDSHFEGKFDGNGHEIVGLQINRSDTNWIGLFGVLSGVIGNVTLTHVDITGNRRVGGLVGRNSIGKVLIVSVNGDITGDKYVGGLAGTNGQGEVVRSTANVDVTGTGWNVGGLVGSNTGEVVESSASGNVDGADNNVGGLVGLNHDGIIKKSYAVGDVTGDSWVGGLVGDARGNSEIMKSFAGGEVSEGENSSSYGSLVGVLGSSFDDEDDISILKDAYWNKITAGQSDAVGRIINEDGTAELQGEVAGLTTDEMQGEAAPENMSVLDFEDTWQVVTDPDDYPILQWQDVTDVDISGQVTDTSGTPIASIAFVHRIGLTGEAEIVIEADFEWGDVPFEGIWLVEFEIKLVDAGDTLESANVTAEDLEEYKFEDFSQIDIDEKLELISVLPPTSEYELANVPTTGDAESLTIRAVDFSEAPENVETRPKGDETVEELNPPMEVNIDVLEGSVVETVDNTPVEDAEIRVYGRSDQSYDEADRHSVSRYGRLIAETTTDENGHADLPIPKEDDDEIVVVAKKGDWFTTAIVDADYIQTTDDYGTIVLDRQLLCDPTVVWSDSGEPFGVVTVWRYLYDEETQIFYTEVTNTNKTLGDELWEISRVSAGHGIEGGSFFFAFPDQSASVLTDHESPFGMEDPTGDGGEHVFVTHPPQNSDPTTAGILHPGRDSGVGLPLYEATKTLGPYSNHDGPDPGWHVLTPESVEEAKELRGLGERSMMLVDLPLSKVKLPGLMDLLEGLWDIADFLEDPETAEINKTPDIPIADGQVPFKLNRAWKHDNPAPFGSREYEMSSVYQVPLQVDDEEQLAVTIRTEWSRDQGNFGIFSATFGTGDLDITTVELRESNGSSSQEDSVDSQSDNERIITTTLRNRSTKEQTPKEIVFKTGASERSLTPDDPQLSDKVPIAPGETIHIDQSVELADPDISDVQPTVAVETEDGITSSRSYERTGQVTGRIVDADGEPVTNAEIEAIDLDSDTTETTTQAGANGDYTLAPPAGKQYKLVVTAPDYESAETTISVQEDITYEENFTLSSDDPLRWEFETGNAVLSSPTVVNNTVFVGSRDNTLYAIDRETGEQLWKFQATNGIDTGPAVVDGIVYFGSNDAELYAVDVEDGSKIWDFKGGYSFPKSPVVKNGTVFIGDGINTFYAIDATSGEEIWSYHIGSALTSPVVVNGRVIFGEISFSEPQLYALDSDDGSEIWTIDMEGRVTSSPTVSNGNVFVGTEFGKLEARDLESGDLIWSYELSSEEPITATPTVADELVFFAGSNNYLIALNEQTGEMEWNATIETSEFMSSSPTVADDTVVIGSMDNNIYGFDIATGSEQWSFETDGVVQSSPIVSEGDVFVGNSQESIYAINTPLSGSSRGSRVSLGTLGHHHVWADNALPDESSVEEYADDDGVVQTTGLLDAIADWQAGEIETLLLLDVIDAWQSGEQVA